MELGRAKQKTPNSLLLPFEFHPVLLVNVWWLYITMRVYYLFHSGVLLAYLPKPGSLSRDEFWGHGFAFSCLCCRVLGSPRPMDWSGKGSSLPKQDCQVGERRQPVALCACVHMRSRQASWLNGRSPEQMSSGWNAGPQALGFLLPREEFSLCNLQRGL